MVSTALMNDIVIRGDLSAKYFFPKIVWSHRREVEQPKVGSDGARRAGASEAKGTERVLAKDPVHEMESPGKSDDSARHPRVSPGAAAPRAERNQEALEAMRRALRVRHYALRTEESSKGSADMKA